MTKKMAEATIEALFTVIDEFEKEPISNSRSNDVLLEILAERVETITSNNRKTDS